MPEWFEVKPEVLEEGDTIRVYKGDFNRVESVVQKDEEDDLFASQVGYFTNTWGADVNWSDNWEKIERKSVIPTEPGMYLSHNNNVLILKSGGTWEMPSSAYFTPLDDKILMNRYAPLERIYFKSDMKKAVLEAKKEAKKEKKEEEASENVDD